MSLMQNMEFIKGWKNKLTLKKEKSEADIRI
jgi:hypothetical protein